jgi:hypothetical protein
MGRREAKARDRLEEWPAEQLECFDTLAKRENDLGVVGIVVSARTGEELINAVDIQLGQREILKQHLEAFMDALEAGNRARLRLLMKEVNAIMDYRREAIGMLIQRTIGAKPEAVKACPDEVCLEDLEVFEDSFRALVDGAYDCP